MKKYILILLIPIISFSVLQAEENILIQDIQKVVKFQPRIQHIHPALKNLYPIAVARGETFSIFDVDSSGKKYELKKKTPTPFPIQKGIRAAFPLQSYDNRYACVVTEEVFDKEADLVLIFHEFIHCFQGESIERKIKDNLGVAQKAKADEDYMWELNYPFPYDNAEFIETYDKFMSAIDNGEVEEGAILRKNLNKMLDIHVYEYMVWQEWKEGFARFIENKMRKAIGLKDNNFGIEKPYTRITFYVGGSKYIQLLGQKEPELLIDIEKLFYKMLETKR